MGCFVPGDVFARRSSLWQDDGLSQLSRSLRAVASDFQEVLGLSKARDDDTERVRDADEVLALALAERDGGGLRLRLDRDNERSGWAALLRAHLIEFWEVWYGLTPELQCLASAGDSTTRALSEVGVDWLRGTPRLPPSVLRLLGWVDGEPGALVPPIVSATLDGVDLAASQPASQPAAATALAA
jgi:hypothetical protein